MLHINIHSIDLAMLVSLLTTLAFAAPMPRQCNSDHESPGIHGCTWHYSNDDYEEGPAIPVGELSEEMRKALENVKPVSRQVDPKSRRAETPAGELSEAL
jgi:hypothetical protein